MHQYLNDDGFAMIDWGLGDHWRYKKFKIGWVRGGEHEEAYRSGNKLWSCLWHHGFSNEPEVQKFLDNVRKHGYASITDAVLDEVPSILVLDDLKIFSGRAIYFKTLYEDRPQLTILVCLDK